MGFKLKLVFWCLSYGVVYKECLATFTAEGVTKQLMSNWFKDGQDGCTSDDPMDCRFPDSSKGPTVVKKADGTDTKKYPLSSLCHIRETPRCVVCYHHNWYDSSCNPLYPGPELTCPKVTTPIKVPTGEKTVVVTWDTPTAKAGEIPLDVKGIYITQGKEPGSQFLPGNHRVSYQVKNVNGQKADCHIFFEVTSTKCPMPPKIPNAIRYCISELYPGSTCNYFCHVGYGQASDYNLITCLPTQKFDKPPPNCIDLSPPRITCYPPNNGTKVFYTDKGKLTANITWKFPTAVDMQNNSIPAERIEELNGKYKSGSAFPRGTHLLVYEVGDVKGKTAACSFSFEVVTPHCPILDGLLNGFVKCFHADMRYGTRCEFMCKPGYKMIGHEFLDCTINGTYSHPPPECHIIRCQFPDLQGSDLECSNGNNLNSVCKVYCHPGFNRTTPHDKVMCGSSGNWTNGFPQCKDIEPPIFLNCPIENLLIEYNSRVDNYATATWPKLLATDNTGEVSVEKISGKSSGDRFEPGISKISYFTEDVSGFITYCNFSIIVAHIREDEYCKPGTRYEYDTGKCVICKKGTYQEHENGVECLDCPMYTTTDKAGAKSSSDCKVMQCPKMVPQIGDMVIKCNGSNIKDSCAFHCPRGLTLVGRTGVTCNVTQNENKVWEAFWDMEEFPICLNKMNENCKKLANPDNGHMTCKPESRRIKCSLTCKEGYNLPLGYQTLICNYSNGIWYPVPRMRDCTPKERPSLYSLRSSIIYDGGSCRKPGVRSRLRKNAKAIYEEYLGWAILCPMDKNCMVDDFTAKCKNSTANIYWFLSVGVKYDENLPGISAAVKTSAEKNLNDLHRDFDDYLDKILLSPITILLRRAVDNFTLNSDKLKKYDFSLRCIHPDRLDNKTMQCLKCPPGTFYNSTTRSSCEECPVNYYQPKMSQLTCNKCPTGTKTNTTGSTLKDQCFVPVKPKKPEVVEKKPTEDEIEDRLEYVEYVEYEYPDEEDEEEDDDEDEDEYEYYEVDYGDDYEEDDKALKEEERDLKLAEELEEEDAAYYDFYGDYYGDYEPMKPTFCKLPDPPSKGKRICNESKSGVTCYLKCSKANNMPRGMDGVFNCDFKKNKWLPKPTIPDCTAIYKPTKLKLPTSVIYVDGKCPKKEELKKIRKSFVNHFKNSTKFKSYCPSTKTCTIQTVRFECDKSELPNDDQLNVYFAYAVEGKNEKIEDQNLALIELYTAMEDQAYETFFNNLVPGFKFDPLSYSGLEPMPACMFGGEFDVKSGTCRVCPPGTKFDVDEDRCRDCQPGTYQNKENSFTCRKCPPGTSTAERRATNMTQCISKELLEKEKEKKKEAEAGPVVSSKDFEDMLGADSFEGFDEEYSFEPPPGWDIDYYSEYDAECADLESPEIGTSECDETEDGVVCTLYCPDGYTIPRGIGESGKFFCKYDQGFWIPKQKMPSCIKKTIAQKMDMYVELTFTDGTCPPESSMASLKTNFTKLLNKSSVSNVTCPSGITCSIYDVRMKCSNSTKSSMFVSWEFSADGKSGDTIYELESQLQEMYYAVYDDINKGYFKNSLLNFKIDPWSYYPVDVFIACARGGKYNEQYDSCTFCPPGTAHNYTNDKCQECEIGFYQEKINGDKCIACPNGGLTPDYGSSNKSDCHTKDYFWSYEFSNPDNESDYNYYYYGEYDAYEYNETLGELYEYDDLQIGPLTDKPKYSIQVEMKYQEGTCPPNTELERLRKKFIFILGTSPSLDGICPKDLTCGIEWVTVVCGEGEYGDDITIDWYFTAGGDFKQTVWEFERYAYALYTGLFEDIEGDYFYDVIPGFYFDPYSYNSLGSWITCPIGETFDENTEKCRFVEEATTPAPLLAEAAGKGDGGRIYVQFYEGPQNVGYKEGMNESEYIEYDYDFPPFDWDYYSLEDEDLEYDSDDYVEGEEGDYGEEEEGDYGDEEGGEGEGDYGTEEEGDYGTEEEGDYGTEEEGDYGTEEGEEGDYGEEEEGDYGEEGEGDYGTEEEGDYGAEEEGDYGTEEEGDYGTEEEGPEEGDYGAEEEGPEEGDYGAEEEGDYGGGEEGQEEGDYGAEEEGPEEGDYGAEEEGDYGAEEGQEESDYGAEEESGGEEGDYSAGEGEESADGGVEESADYGASDEGTDESAGGEAEESADYGADQSVDYGADESADYGADGGAEDSADGGAEESADYGADGGAEESADYGANGGAEESADYGADGGAEESADYGADGGAEESADYGNDIDCDVSPEGCKKRRKRSTATCPKPTTTDPTIRYVCKSGLEQGKECKILCATGYKPEGATSMICTTAGKWELNRNEPTRCPDLLHQLCSKCAVKTKWDTTCCDTTFNFNNIQFGANLCPDLKRPRIGRVNCTQALGIKKCDLKCGRDATKPRDFKPYTCSVLYNTYKPLNHLPSCIPNIYPKAISHTLSVKYLHGDCSSSAIRDKIKTRFETILNKAPGWKRMCPKGRTCVASNFVVSCGSKQQRKRKRRDLHHLMKRATISVTTIQWDVTMTYVQDAKVRWESMKNNQMKLVIAMFGLLGDIDGGHLSNLLPGFTLDFSSTNTDNKFKLTCPGGDRHVYSDFYASCLACPPGSRYNKASKSCEWCPQGYYQEKYDSTECLKCPTGKSTRETGTDNSTLCKLPAELTTQPFMTTTTPAPKNTCGKPPALKDTKVIVKCKEMKLRSDCFFSCPGGKMPRGADTYSCTYPTYKWSLNYALEPTCPADSTKCQNLANPEFGTSKCTDKNTTVECRIVCNNNYYTHKNFEVFTCNKSVGKWLPGEQMPPCMPPQPVSRYTIKLLNPYFKKDCTTYGNRENLRVAFLKLLLKEPSWKESCQSNYKCLAERVVVNCTEPARPDVSWYFSVVTDASYTGGESTKYKTIVSEMFFQFGEALESNKQFDSVAGFWLVYGEYDLKGIGPGCNDGALYNSDKGVCVACPKGTYYEISFDQCVLCPEGTYISKPNSFVCDLCPKGQITPSPGAQSKALCNSPCLPGTYSATGMQPCTSCPDGGTSSRGSKTCDPKQPRPRIKDFCDPNPCGNGTCQNRPNNFSCSCLPGFHGDRCNITNNVCTFSKCDNGARCKADGKGFYKCICKKDYTGFYCQFTNVNKNVSRWSAWTSWSNCSVTCGQGTQNRTRVCTLGSKKVPCPGQATDKRVCNKERCPECRKESLLQPEGTSINCTGTPRSMVCRAVCKKGYEHKKMPPITSCLKNVWKPSKNITGCTPISYWKPWSAWTDCVFPCVGDQIRQRKCIIPKELEKSRHCAGDSYEKKSCKQNKTDAQCKLCDEKDLVLGSGSKVNCTGKPDQINCTVMCEQGKVFIDAPPRFNCNKGSWTSGLKVMPCTDLELPESLTLLITVEYSAIPCDNPEALGNLLTTLKTRALTFPCVKNMTCLYSLLPIPCTLKAGGTPRVGITYSMKSIPFTNGTIRMSEILGANKTYIQMTELKTAINALEQTIDYINHKKLLYVKDANNKEAKPDEIVHITTVQCPKDSINRGMLCVKCPPGTFFTFKRCDICPRGYYQSQMGKSSCNACPAGYTTPDSGSISSDQCIPIGHFL